MLLDILGFIVLALFIAIGVVIIFWAGLVSVATFTAVIGAIFEDLRSLDRLFRR